MKTEKIRLTTIKKVLNRSELKKIMAGSGTCGQQCIEGYWPCNFNCSCSDGFCTPV